MKKILFGLLIVGFLFSCSKENDSELIGTWKLIEIYNDPGNGSGSFQSVNSQKTIEFKSDGTLISNGEVCLSSIDSDTIVNGTYSESAMTINIPTCPTLSFEQDGNELILRLPCLEPCLNKYQRL